VFRGPTPVRDRAQDRGSNARARVVGKKVDRREKTEAIECMDDEKVLEFFGRFEVWLKSRCDVIGCWNTYRVQCMRCGDRVCRDHMVQPMEHDVRDPVGMCRRCAGCEAVEYSSIGDFLGDRQRYIRIWMYLKAGEYR
jgi:hypothetical protein